MPFVAWVTRRFGSYASLFVVVLLGVWFALLAAPVLAEAAGSPSREQSVISKRSIPAGQPSLSGGADSGSATHPVLGALAFLGSALGNTGDAVGEPAPVDRGADGPPPPAPDCVAGTITNGGAPALSPSNGVVPITVSTTTGSWNACDPATVDYYNVLWYVNGGVVASGVWSYTVTTPNVPVWASVQACSFEWGCSAWANSNTGSYLDQCSVSPFTNTAAPVISPTSGNVPITVSSTAGSWSPCPGGTLDYYNVQWYVSATVVATNVWSYTVTTADAAVWTNVQACSFTWGCSGWVSSNAASYSNPPANRPPTLQDPVSPGLPADFSYSFWTSLDSSADAAPAHNGPFRIKYVDPDGDSGKVTFFVYDEFESQVAGEWQDNVVSGTTLNFLSSLSISPGDYHWVATADDHHGHLINSAYYYFHVDWRPDKPTLSSPKLTGGGTPDLPSLMPVLSATGADADGDTLGYKFTITTLDPTGCPLPGGQTSVDSGYLYATSTYTVPSGYLKDGCTYSWTVRTTDYAQLDDGTANESQASDSLQFRVKLPKLGLRDYWPIWSRGPVAVNEATGNLVLSVPGPSYPSAAGSLGASASYNLLDTRASVFPGTSPNPGSWTLGIGEDPPANLIDHSRLPDGTADKFDAVELVAPDGSSDFYTHVGGSDTYQSPPGDTSVLSRKPGNNAGFLLTDPDGSSYEFGPADTNGVATLVTATVSSNLGQTKLAYSFINGKAQTITASGKDNGGAFQTLSTLQFKWAGDPACTDALLCVTGPDNVTWKYIGESGATGKLTTVYDGVRNILQIGYDGNGRPSTIKNANDLNPGNASPGYSTAHQLQVAYDTNGKVQNVTETQVRNRFDTSITGGSDPFSRRDLVWSFAYSCPGLSLQAPVQSHAPTQSPSTGCTELTLPKGQKAQVFYDNVGHPLESRDPLGNYTLSQYNDRDQLAWSEDALHYPTDYAYDSFSFLPTSVTGPDPDTVGSGLPRALTSYFYDETKAGDGTSSGPAWQGMQASYFSTPDLSGLPTTRRNDANVDFTWSAQNPPPLGGQTTNFSVRWTGILTVAAQTTKVFATVADGGSRLTVDGVSVIDQWSGQTSASPVCSGQAIALGAGKHRIVLEYNAASTAKVKLEWGGSCGTQTVVAQSDLQPGWFNQTSVIGYASTTGTSTRLAFSHIAAPETHHPDYTLADATGTKLITSYGYDSYGRITSEVMPKGNASRTITTNGDLTGTITSGFDTSYSYYQAGTQASSAACGTGLANQVGLPQTTTASGLHAATSVYDTAGRAVELTNAAGTTCRTYDNEGRLTADKAPGESQPTTYGYDPAGLLRTATNANGTITNIYDESGALIDGTDSYGAESELAHDKDGNLTQRRVATGPLATGTVYTTTNSYDNDDQLTQTTDPAGKPFTFSYDARGALVGTQYPNGTNPTGTFSWNDYLPTGWLKDTYNRHGTAPAPGGTPPADANALSDFGYQYFADGRRRQEIRTGSNFGGGETTNYTYDGAGRLAGLSGQLNRTYCYDLDSNRSALYNTTGATCGQGTADASYSYPSGQGVDQLGTVTTSSGRTTAYSYLPNGDGQVTARAGDTFSWDGRGRLSGGSFPGLSRTQFRVDGATSGNPVAGGSPSKTLDTTTLSNGWHTLGANATDRNGKQAAAPTRVINVQNGTPASPPIQFVREILNTATTAVSTVTLTVQAPGFPVGDTLVVLAGKTSSTVTSVTDSKGNGYAVDEASVSNGATNVAIYSARVTTALTATDTITVTFGSNQKNPAVAFALEFSGIAAPPNKTDQVALGKTGTGTALSTNATTNSTDHQIELSIGGFGASVNSTFTAGSGYTSGTPAVATVSNKTLAIHAEWRLTSVQGTQSATATLGSSGTWASGLATYRANDLTGPSQPASLAATATPGTTTLSWTASTDPSGIAYYHVYRSTSSGFTPGPANEIGQTTLTAYTDNGDGTTNGLPAATYYYKVIAQDALGNQSTTSTQASSTVTADTSLPKAVLTAPATGTQQAGTITLSATASDPIPDHTISYGFDATGFRRSRTLDGTTTRYLLGGLIETNTSATITLFDTDSPAGDLIHYDGPPTTGAPTYLYYTGHGDIATQLVGSETTPTAANTFRYDPFGELTTSPTSTNTIERFTGHWDKKLDPISDLIEMGARPYDPQLGRFYAIDPIDGGSLNGYDYAAQDPINSYDLDGTERSPRWVVWGSSFDEMPRGGLIRKRFEFRGAASDKNQLKALAAGARTDVANDLLAQNKFVSDAARAIFSPLFNFLRARGGGSIILSESGATAASRPAGEPLLVTVGKAYVRIRKYLPSMRHR